MTIREFTSAVKSSLDSFTLDTYVSSEYIYTIGLSNAKLITKREADSRKIFRNTSIFKYDDCFKMKPVKVSECSEIPLSCKSIMKSVKKLPDIFLSNYGSLILVHNNNNDKGYSETNPNSYRSIKNQRFQSKTNGYFWVQNGYLIIPDSEVEVVTILYLSSELEENSSSSSSNSCSILDNNFPVLNYLESVVIEATVKHILITKNINRDENSNLDETK